MKEPAMDLYDLLRYTVDAHAEAATPEAATALRAAVSYILEAIFSDSTPESVDRSSAAVRAQLDRLSAADSAMTSAQTGTRHA